MHIRIRRPDCCGNALCAEIAPAVFAIDSRRKAVILDADAASLEIVLEAAEACPSQAIEVEGEDGETLA